jgi:hypothetical protein
VTVGGVTAGITYGASSGASVSAQATDPSASQPSASAQAGFRRAAAALVAKGYRVDLEERSETDCAAHSYGQVEQFFQLHPCKWVARAYLAVRNSTQGLVLVAISWVDMPDAVTAASYKHLVDGSGTGNVTELSRDIGPYRNIAYSGEFYASGMIGTSVWNAQAQPVEPTLAAVVNQILATSSQ